MVWRDNEPMCLAHKGSILRQLIEKHGKNGLANRACHLKMAGDRKIDHAELVRRSIDDRLPNLN